MTLVGAKPAMSECVTPVAVSYVSSEDASAHGGGPEDWIPNCATMLDNAMAARKTVREPEVPVEAYGRVAEKICPLLTAKRVAAPMMEPLAL
jgi:hypothetical protein